MLYLFRHVMSLFPRLNITVLHYQGRFMCILTPAKYRGCGKSLYHQNIFKMTPHISIPCLLEIVYGAQVIFLRILKCLIYIRTCFEYYYGRGLSHFIFLIIVQVGCGVSYLKSCPYQFQEMAILRVSLC